MPTPAVAQPLAWRAGDPARVTVSVVDADGVPVSLAGSTWTAQVRQDRERDVLATMTTDASNVDGGEVSFDLTGAQTRAIREAGGSSPHIDVEGSAHGTLVAMRAVIERDVTRVDDGAGGIVEPTGGLGDVLDLVLTGTTVEVVAQSVVAFGGVSAVQVPFAPTGSIEATDVQAAIVELDADLATEAATRAALDGRLDAVESTLPTKADLVAGVVPDGQLPAGLTRDDELVAGLAAKAPLVDAALTGTPTVPTAPAGDVSTKVANTAFVKGAVDNATSSAGLLADRPAAGAGNSGQLYFATDVIGGTLYRSNGTSWVQVSPAVAEPSRSRLMFYAPQMGKGAGSPVIGDIGGSVPGRTQAWLLDATADEGCVIVTTIPYGWQAVDLVVYWTNAGDGSGDVMWWLTGGEVAIGSLPPNMAMANAAAATAPAKNVFATTTMSNVVTAANSPAGDEVWRFHVRRDAPHVEDTLPNDAGVYAVELRQAS